MESRRWLLALAMSATLGAGACTQSTPEEVESEAVVPVRTVAAEKGTIRGVVRATGLVTPAPGAELIVIAPEAARITEIHLGEGERVKRGDVLVRFEIPGAAAEVQKQAAEVKRAQAALANATANQTRAQDLFKRVWRPGRKWKTPRADCGRAGRQSRRPRQHEPPRKPSPPAPSLHATFDGLVAKRHHSPGDVVEASAARILLLRASIPSISKSSRLFPAATSGVALGGSARLAGRFAGESDVALKVVSRPSAVDPGTATIPVRLGFVRPTNLPAGAPVQVDIEAEKHEGAVIVPDSAIVREGDETAVFVVNDNKAARHEVKTGLSDGERIEILSGVSAGDQVIVEGQAGLPDGAAVTTATPESHTPAKEDK